MADNLKEQLELLLSINLESPASAVNKVVSNYDQFAKALAKIEARLLKLGQMSPGVTKQLGANVQKQVAGLRQIMAGPALTSIQKQLDSLFDLKLSASTRRKAAENVRKFMQDVMNKTGKMPDLQIGTQLALQKGRGVSGYGLTPAKLQDILFKRLDRTFKEPLAPVAGPLTRKQRKQEEIRKAAQIAADKLSEAEKKNAEAKAQAATQALKDQKDAEAQQKKADARRKQIRDANRRALKRLEDLASTAADSGAPLGTRGSATEQMLKMFGGASARVQAKFGGRLKQAADAYSTDKASAEAKAQAAQAAAAAQKQANASARTTKAEDTLIGRIQKNFAKVLDPDKKYTAKKTAFDSAMEALATASPRVKAAAGAQLAAAQAALDAAKKKSEEEKAETEKRKRSRRERPDPEAMGGFWRFMNRINERNPAFVMPGFAGRLADNVKDTIEIAKGGGAGIAAGAAGLGINAVHAVVTRAISPIMTSFTNIVGSPLRVMQNILGNIFNRFTALISAVVSVRALMEGMRQANERIRMGFATTAMLDRGNGRRRGPSGNMDQYTAGVENIMQNSAYQREEIMQALNNALAMKATLPEAMKIVQQGADLAAARNVPLLEASDAIAQQMLSGLQDMFRRLTGIRAYVGEDPYSRNMRMGKEFDKRFSGRAKEMSSQDVYGKLSQIYSDLKAKFGGGVLAGIAAHLQKLIEILANLNIFDSMDVSKYTPIKEGESTNFFQLFGKKLVGSVGSVLLPVDQLKMIWGSVATVSDKLVASGTVMAQNFISLIMGVAPRIMTITAAYEVTKWRMILDLVAKAGPRIISSVISTAMSIWKNQGAFSADDKVRSAFANATPQDAKQYNEIIGKFQALKANNKDVRLAESLWQEAGGGNLPFSFKDYEKSQKVAGIFGDAEKNFKSMSTMLDAKDIVKSFQNNLTGTMTDPNLRGALNLGTLFGEIAGNVQTTNPGLAGRILSLDTTLKSAVDVGRRMYADSAAERAKAGGGKLGAARWVAPQLEGLMDPYGFGGNVRGFVGSPAGGAYNFQNAMSNQVMAVDSSGNRIYGGSPGGRSGVGSLPASGNAGPTAFQRWQAGVAPLDRMRNSDKNVAAKAKTQVPDNFLYMRYAY